MSEEKITLVVLFFSIAAAIVGGIAFHKEPSVECVKAGGTWVYVKYGNSSRDHCQSKP